MGGITGCQGLGGPWWSGKARGEATSGAAGVEGCRGALVETLTASRHAEQASMCANLVRLSTATSRNPRKERRTSQTIELFPQSCEAMSRQESRKREGPKPKSKPTVYSVVH